MSTRKDDLVERIWHGAGEEERMSPEQLVGTLRPRVERGSRVLYTYLWTYLLIQMGTLVLAGANLPGYRSNPVMLGVEGAICLSTLAFAAYGIWLFGEVRRLERMDEPLVVAVRRRLAFYRTSYRAWLWITALSLVMFSFALNTLIDNVDGRYPINHPLVFFGTQVGMLVLVVASFHLAHGPYLGELRAVLADLEAQVLDRTLVVDRDRGRARAWRLVLVAVLLALLALGAWLALSRGA